MFIAERIMKVYHNGGEAPLMAFALDLVQGWDDDGLDTKDIEANITEWRRRARAHDYSEAHCHALFASGYDVGARRHLMTPSEAVARQEVILKRWGGE